MKKKAEPAERTTIANRRNKNKNKRQKQKKSYYNKIQ